MDIPTTKQTLANQITTLSVEQATLREQEEAAVKQLDAIRNRLTEIDRRRHWITGAFAVLNDLEKEAEERAKSPNTPAAPNVATIADKKAAKAKA